MDFHRDRSARREQIERELKRDPSRSNRAIARLLGVDHKLVGRVRDQIGDDPNDPTGALGHAPDASGSSGGALLGHDPEGKILQGGEIDRDDKSNDRFGWGDVPGDAYWIPTQAMTAAFIDQDTGDLVIMQDKMHLMQEDVIVRIGVFEIETFIEQLVAMVRAQSDTKRD
jgi:hypothetical protein